MVWIFIAVFFTYQQIPAKQIKSSNWDYLCGLMFLETYYIWIIVVAELPFGKEATSMVPFFRWAFTHLQLRRYHKIMHVELKKSFNTSFPFIFFAVGCYSRSSNNSISIVSLISSSFFPASSKPTCSNFNALGQSE